MATATDTRYTLTGDEERDRFVAACWGDHDRGVDAAGLYWWHRSVIAELIRLRDECGVAGYGVRGLAGNLRDASALDVARWCDQLVAAGALVSVEPQLKGCAPDDAWFGLS